ncbi:MAG TPA: sarcosine oxidase subunit beta family protein [Aestuariivirgaceae bacterium]|jgi:sarcosine oxidase subunit beta
MTRYSIFSIARNAMHYHKDWERVWRSPNPKPEYDAVIVGAGGHGLATAYYLAKEHKMTNIAVVEKGWLGGGNTGRNTTIIRSNYLQDASIAIYELSRGLYEGLSRELNYNVMFSPRGLLMLCQTEHELRALKRTSHANRLAGLDCRMITAQEAKRLVPLMNVEADCRYPVLGAYYQPRGGTARHDAVAWGYARGADALGVDIIQNCEVTGVRRNGQRIAGVETTKGFIRTRKVGVVAAGHTSVIMQMAGVRMPIESVCLQALVSEPIKPVIDCVIMANTVHGYISQSDKGELVIGGGADPYNNYSQRGSFPALQQTVTALVETFPFISRLKALRLWGGIVDMTGDRSPIISLTDVEGLYVNCGWGTGGFKSIPGSGFVFADTIANGRPHKIAEPFSLNRFAEGRLIDESVAAAVAH